jgi:DNA-binding protein HU-beta
VQFPRRSAKGEVQSLVHCIFPSEVSMNKSELIEHIAKSADISKSAAGRALDAAIDGIEAALKEGQEVSLVGFGSFYVSERAARSGRNPKTGATIEIEAAKVPKFRPGKGLKDAIN